MADKNQIKGTVDDLVSNFLYYDRKEDEDLPMDEINRMVKSGEVTVDEMVGWFRDSLQKGLAETDA